MERIYILIDPNTLQPRYVGYTSTPLKTRLGKHIGSVNKKRTFNTFKNRWLRKLLKNNQVPKIKSIYKIKDGRWQYWERYYIALYRSLGYNLTNGTDGGEGGKGRVMREEQKKKIGDFHRGKKISDWQKQQISKAVKGRKFSKESKKKISKGNKGKHNAIPIKVTNLLSGDIKTYHSAQAASDNLKKRGFKISRKLISIRITKGMGIVNKYNERDTTKFKFEKA